MRAPRPRFNGNGHVFLYTVAARTALLFIGDGGCDVFVGDGRLDGWRVSVINIRAFSRGLFASRGFSLGYVCGIGEGGLRKYTACVKGFGISVMS